MSWYSTNVWIIPLLSIQSHIDSAIAVCDQELEGVKGQLSGEQSGRFKAEAELAEARNRLEAVRELEKELSRYRALESEADAAKGRAGIWGYISGK